MTASALLSSTAPTDDIPFDGTEAPACAAPLVQDTDTDTITTLEGQELLDFMADNPGLKEIEYIKATGHYKLIDGKPRLNRARYYKAISAANGFAPAKPERKPRGETGPRGVLKVGPNGLIPVGAAYSRLLGLTPGTFVSVYKDEGVLVIEPGTDEAVASAEAEAAKASEAPAAEAPAAEAPKAKAKAKKA
jgi:hypothetical protein